MSIFTAYERLPQGRSRFPPVAGETPSQRIRPFLLYHNDRSACHTQRHLKMLTTGKKDIPNFDLNYHFSWQEAQFAKTERLIILSAILAQCSAWTLNLRIFFLESNYCLSKLPFFLSLLLSLLLLLLLLLFSIDNYYSIILGPLLFKAFLQVYINCVCYSPQVQLTLKDIHFR